MNEVPDEFICRVKFSGNIEDVKYGMDEQHNSYISDIEVQVIDGPLAGKRLRLNIERDKTLVLCPLKETKVYRWICLEECTWYRDNKCPLLVGGPWLK